MKSLSRLSACLLFACWCVAAASPSRAQEPSVGAVSFASCSGESVTYQINAAHTGAIQIKGFTPPLTVKWSVDLGAPVSYPLIACGKVFVLAGPNGTDQVNLYALNAETGAVDWGPMLIPEGSWWWAAAAYDNGAVYVVPESSPLGDGAMLAFDAADGHQLWTAPLSLQWGFSSPPTAVNGLVYTGGAGDGGTLYAVAESNGKTVWTAPVANGDNSSPAVSPSGVYVSYVCPQTYSFNPRNGKQIWNFSGPCEGGGGDTPVLYNGSLYVLDSNINEYNGAILNATNGALVGFFNSEFVPAFLGSSAFYTGYTTLTATNISTHLPEWTAAPSSGDFYASPPIVVNNVVYVGTAAGYLEGYNALSGANVSRVNVGSAISAYGGGGPSSPLAGLGAGEGLIVVPASNLVVALAPESVRMWPEE